MTENQIIVYNYLKSNGACSVATLVTRLYDNPGLYEREVKEALQRLMERGVVKPDCLWRMEAV